MSGEIFLQVTAVMALITVLGFVLSWLKQPMIIAYICAGAVAGPLLFDLIDGERAWEAFSKMGVVFLLFLVGLDMSVKKLKEIGKSSVIGGVLQMLVTGVLAYLMMLVLGIRGLPAVFLATALVFSSTIVIIKLLGEKKVLHTIYGRYTVGLLIVQDVIALVLIMFITVYGGESLGGAVERLLFRGVSFGAIVYLASKYLLPGMMKKASKSGEFLFMLGIGWCFILSSFAEWAGFSLEIGAVAAGISLGVSDYALSLRSKVKPLQDFFIMIFFVILGSKLQTDNIREAFGSAVAISGFILVVKSVAIFLIYRKLRFTRRNAFMIGIICTQVSEFGFIISVMGKDAGVVSDLHLAIFTLSALMTITISSYFITYNEYLFKVFSKFFKKKDNVRQKEEKMESYDVWLIGDHHIGWKVFEKLKKEKVRFAVIDHDPRVVHSSGRDGVPVFFGDVQDFEFLNSLGIENSEVVISTIADQAPQMFLCEYLRRKKSKARLITTLEHQKNAEKMYDAGADYVLLPQLESGLLLAGLVKKGKVSVEELPRMRDRQMRSFGV